MEYAKLLQQSAGKFDYRESPLKTVMKVNDLRKTIDKDGRANIIRKEPYANKIATYLSKEELNRQINEGAIRYKLGVQNEYNNLVLEKLKNRKDDEYMKTAKSQSDFIKLLSDPSKVEYLNKVDPFGLFILRQKQEKNKVDFLNEKDQLEKYKRLRQTKPQDALEMYQFSDNPLIKLFGSHPEDENIVNAMKDEVGQKKVAERIVAHSAMDANLDNTDLSEEAKEQIHKRADQVPISDPSLRVETFPFGEPITLLGETIEKVPTVEKQYVSTLSGATGPEGPITITEAEDMSPQELKRYMRVNYSYNIKAKTKSNMIKELQEKQLVSSGTNVESLPSFLPEDLDETYEQKDETMKKEAIKAVTRISLLSLLRIAEKDLTQIDEEHNRNIEKLEQEKALKKAEAEKQYNSKLQEIQEKEQKQKSDLEIVKRALDKYTTYSKQEPQKVDAKESDILLKDYQKKQQVYNKNQEKLEESKKKHSEESRLKQIEQIEKEHTKKREKLEEEHKKKVSKYSKGKGFKPLSSFPPHIIAGALHKNYLRYRHLIPNQNEYNREQAHKLTQKVLHGGAFFQDFKSIFPNMAEIKAKLSHLK
jgi:hypothetical protein